ncbi:RlpA-like double-psi beta-barrel-protein domain-containing protein-containing protein [Mycena sp. CBHHK59/15]|nr:RlpA-like double-psi beta-barrel-protein domain-containing protein-containing protein [Mycena sp. CBHHK59/15]
MTVSTWSRSACNQLRCLSSALSEGRHDEGDHIHEVDASNTSTTILPMQCSATMFSTVLLFFVLSVSGLDVNVLFSSPDFFLFDHAHAGLGSNTTVTTFPLEKRYDQARFTFFDTGLGACGTTNSPSDFIVALNSPQYDNGQHCYEMIEITYNGKSARAQIVDECPGCPWGALDFSTGLFDYFASEDKGAIYGSWVFSGGPGTSAASGTGQQTSTSTAPAASTTTRQTLSSATKSTSPSATATSASSPASPSASTMSSGLLEEMSVVLGSVAGLIVLAVA